MTDDDQPRDINEIVVDDWVTDTTTFERVRTVVRHRSAPTTATDIADQARVDPETARDHLATLVADCEVVAMDREGTRYFAPNPVFDWVRTVWRFTRQASKAELVDRYDTLTETIQTHQTDTGCATPDEYAQTLDDDSTATDAHQRLTDWRTARQSRDRLADAICVYDIFDQLTAETDIPVTTPHGDIDPADIFHQS